MAALALSGQRLDRLGISLSGLCVVHCLVTTLAVALLASVGSLLGAPIVHESGLVVAMLIGVVALGRGLADHGYALPSIVGGLGLALMGSALRFVHGSAGEVGFTIAGVLILALAHRLNGMAAE